MPGPYGNPYGKNSYGRNSYGRNSYGNSYGNYGSSVPRPTASQKYFAAMEADGGRRRKTKGKKTRKMRGSGWFDSPPPPSMSQSQGTLTNTMSRDRQIQCYFNPGTPGCPQGGGSGNYSDGASYGMYVNGTGGSQWARTMDQSGAYGKVPGNTIIGAQGQNVQPSSQMPSPANLALVQKAGRRKKGGFLGEVVSQAVVPFALLGMQQTYRRKKGGKKGTRKNRKTRKH
jgi:hypothetical protein